MKVKEIVARYKKSGKKFEILINWDKFKEYREGRVDIEEVVIGEGVFSDVRKAERAKEEDIREVFGNKPLREIYSIIIKEGEMQLTEEHRKEILEEKRKRIINFLVTHAIDARSNIPFTPTRIELALEQAKFRVDLMESTEKQIERAIKALRPILPIKIEKKRFMIRIPIEYAGPARGKIMRIATIKSEDWGSTSYVLQVEIPAGLMNELISVVNEITKGNGVVEEMKR